MNPDLLAAPPAIGGIGDMALVSFVGVIGVMREV
jgi:hypothetical protein